VRHPDSRLGYGVRRPGLVRSAYSRRPRLPGHNAAAETAPTVCEIVKVAHSLGVADIRIIPAAQEGDMIEGVQAIPQDILDAHPILRYRLANLLAGRAVRGIKPCDTNRCFMALDDSVVSGGVPLPVRDLHAGAGLAHRPHRSQHAERPRRLVPHARHP
jgi:hypothetical protein